MKKKQKPDVNEVEIKAQSVEQDPDIKPDWKNECEVCGAVPTHPVTGMCGPCSFGEAETIGGSW